MTTHDPDCDFDQFRHFDRPVSPSAATLSTLRHRLSASTPEGEELVGEISQEAALEVTALTPRRHRTQPPRFLRPWAAAILAFIVVASSLAIIQQPNDPVRLAFQPDAPANTDVNAAGTAGRTWQFGDQDPVVGNPVWSKFSPTTMDLRGTVVVDGSVIVNLMPTEGQQSSLARIDLATGELYWQRNLVVTGIYAADDEHLFGFWRPVLEQPLETQLIAIDLESGEIAWRGPMLAEQSYGSGATAVVDGGMVYAMDFLGNLVSVNASTGTQNWQFPEQFRIPTSTEDGARGGIFLPPQLAISQDAVFIVRPSQSVASFDRATGQEIGEINVLDDYASMTRQVDIAVSESFLVVMALAPVEVTQSRLVSQWEVQAELLVFDRITLDLVGRTSIPDLRGFVAIQGDTAFVPMSDGAPSSPTDNRWNPRSRIDAIDLESVTVTSQITGLDGGRQLLLSLSGTTLIVPRATGTIDFYAIPTMQRTDSVTIDVPESEYAFLFPVQMDGTTPIVIGSIGEIYMLNGPPMTSTPEAAGSSSR